MNLYTAPEEVPFKLPNIPSIFLAGSIEQGAAREWQQLVISELQDEECVIFNPRRAEWDASWVQSSSNPVFCEQVNWELDSLDRADIVFFYFQAGTQSPITLAEFGKVTQLVEIGEDVKIIVVCEPGFWRRGNIEVMCNRCEVPVFDSLEEGTEVLASWLLRLPT